MQYALQVLKSISVLNHCFKSNFMSIRHIIFTVLNDTSIMLLRFNHRLINYSYDTYSFDPLINLDTSQDLFKFWTIHIPTPYTTHMSLINSVCYTITMCNIVFLFHPLTLVSCFGRTYASLTYSINIEKGHFPNLLLIYIICRWVCVSVNMYRTIADTNKLKLR